MLISYQTFCDKYVLTDRLLGSGAFGSVFMAIEQTTRTQLACKVVDLRRIGRTSEQSGLRQQRQAHSDGYARGELRKVRIWADKQKRQIPLEKKFNSYVREFEILSSISHANIIALDKVFITDNNIYVFQDLVTAGDLFSYVESKSHSLLEVEAAVIIRQVLVAVQYLHEHRIAHRDIKPENVMLTSLVTGARVVLTDFGSARRILPMQRATTFAGTEEYGAPEMMNQRSKFFSTSKKARGYSLAIDMWSVGTVSTLLLVGFRAFDNPNGRHDSTLAVKAELNRLEEDKRWRSLGERPKNFVRQLLVLEEDERLTAEAALQHPWFSNDMHKTDFEELYKRTTKNWRPRIPNVPLAEFVHGRCCNVTFFESSQRILEGQRPARGRFLTPAEPPYKPFHRKVYDKTGLWPAKRKRGHGMSEEQVKAIEQWNGVMSEPLNISRAAQQADGSQFKNPEKPLSVATSPGRETLLTTSKRLELQAFDPPSEGTLDRSRSDQVSAIVGGVAEHFPARKRVRGRSNISLPLRPSLVRSTSFYHAEPRGLRKVGLNALRPTSVNTPRTECKRVVDQIPETDCNGQPWALNVTSRSRLRSRSSTPDQHTATTPLKKQGGSVFVIEDDTENSGTSRLESAREARDSVLLAALKESMVKPHGAHLRLVSDQAHRGWCHKL